MIEDTKANNGIPISASEATIKTATIEVKVMKIGNRQVTLAVFRQLKSEPIIDPETGELRGTPWGRVNYHVDCEEGGHLHIVWQKGGELRRAIAKSDPLQSGTSWCAKDSRLGDYEHAYLVARILEGWVPDSKGSVPSLPSWFDFCLEGEVVRLYIDEYVVRNAWGKDESGAFFVSDYAKGKLQEIIHKRGLPLDSDLILNDYLLPVRGPLNSHKEKWRQSYTQLEQLDQLFIAV